MNTLRYYHILFTMICFCTLAQAQTMTMHLRSGSMAEYPTKDIESVTFANTENPAALDATMTIHLLNGMADDFLTKNVESIVFTDGDTDVPFTLYVSDITAVSAKLKVTPKDESVRYYYDVTTAANLSKYTVAEIVEDYIDLVSRKYPSLTLEQILDTMLESGQSEDEVSGLPPGTDMVMYAIAVDETGHCTGKGVGKNFRTLDGGDPAACTFDISYTGLYSTGLNVVINPSDPTVRYWMGLMAADDYPGDFAMTVAVKNSIDEYVSQQGIPLDRVVNGITFIGEASSEESGLQPDTSYYIYVYAMDEEGNAAGPMFKKIFKTPAADYSDAGVSIRYRYYDGNDLMAAYPGKFTNLGGRVLIQVEATPNDLAEHYIWGLASGDLTDETIYPEESSKQALLNAGFLDVPAKNLIAEYGQATFLYFASDAYGIDGQLCRMLADITRERASPASSYSDITATSASEAKTIKMQIDRNTRSKLLTPRLNRPGTRNTFRQLMH